MSYGVLTLSTRTTFLDTVLYLEDSTEQVPFFFPNCPNRIVRKQAFSREDYAVTRLLYSETRNAKLTAAKLIKLCCCSPADALSLRLLDSGLA